MPDASMPSMQLRMSPEEFKRLPRNAAYQYEYCGDVARIAPWPRFFHARLDLRHPSARHDQTTISCHPVRAEDVLPLGSVFASAFEQLQPFGSLSKQELQMASEAALQHTWQGGDGPLVEAATFGAKREGEWIGAIFITLLPGGDPTEHESYHWQESAPKDLWTRRQGQPHLTWIFVDRRTQSRGVGTRLLGESARVLADAGYTHLWTTFLLGNDSCPLWHWRNGFELLQHPLSKRHKFPS